jgi:hypothetical protein
MYTYIRAYMKDYLLKQDEALLLNRGFHQELHGTLWGTDRHGRSWCCDRDQSGEYMMFALSLDGPGLLTTFQTMTRDQFEDNFRA